MPEVSPRRMRTAPTRTIKPHHHTRLEFLNELQVLLGALGISKSRRTALLPACGPDASHGSRVDRTPTRMGRIVEFIDENLDSPLSIDRLAEEADLSRYHFSRVFRQELGQSPWSYVREARVQRAKSLLEAGVSPAEAALDAGFCDQSHLTKEMKRTAGTTPKKYQRDAQADRTNLQE